MDDPERLGFLTSLPSNYTARTVSHRAAPMLEGFLLTLTPDARDAGLVLQALGNSSAVQSELLQLLDVLEDRAEHRTFALAEAVPDAATFRDVALALHARYTRDEVLAALGRSTLAKPFSHREGPLWDSATNTDYFFITLEK